MIDPTDIKTLQAAGWNRDQAVNLANQCRLVDQIEEMTAERDAYAKAADDMAASHKAERDALTAQVGELNASRFAYASEFALDAEGHSDVDSTHQNIRALKDAARLALGALEQCNAADLDCTVEIAALKAVL